MHVFGEPDALFGERQDDATGGEIIRDEQEVGKFVLGQLMPEHLIGTSFDEFLSADVGRWHGNGQCFRTNAFGVQSGGGIQHFQHGGGRDLPNDVDATLGAVRDEIGEGGVVGAMDSSVGTVVSFG